MALQVIYHPGKYLVLAIAALLNQNDIKFGNDNLIDQYSISAL